MFRSLLCAVCVLGLVAAAAAAPGRPETEAEQKARMKWWTEARFGMFIHWGLYALPARHEWVKNQEHITDADYQKYFDQLQSRPLRSRRHGPRRPRRPG